MLYGLCLILSGFTDIFIPRILGKFIDAIVSGIMNRHILWSYSLQTAVAIILMYIICYIWGYGLFSKAYELQWNLRKKLMEHFLLSRSPYFEKFRTGDLIARGTQDISTVASSTSYGLMVLMDGTIFISALILVMAFTTNIWLTLAAVIPLCPMVYLFEVQGRLVDSRYEKSQETFSQVNNEVLEMVDGIRVIRAYVKEDLFVENFKKQTTDLYQKNIDVEKANALFGPVVKFFEGVSMIVALALGSFLVAKGKITVGDMVSFQMYLSMMIWPLMALSELVLLMRRGNASMRRYQEVLKATDDITRTTQKPAAQMGVIEFKNYSFHYPKASENQLDSIDLTIKPKSTLGIVGKIGSGKSTLVKQLINQYAPGSGQLLMDGEPYHHYCDADIRHNISYVPQENILFSRSVRDNIRFGKQEASEEDILKAVELASFTKDLKHLSDGLDTLVGEKGASVSGGQKQRIAIARALIKNSDLLILDDSLSAVDTKTEQAIIENIKLYRSNQTNIIISHRLSAVKGADEIIVMDRGKIVERGKHQELMNLKGWYYEQFKRQELKGEGRADENY